MSNASIKICLFVKAKLTAAKDLTLSDSNDDLRYTPNIVKLPIITTSPIARNALHNVQAKADSTIYTI